MLQMTNNTLWTQYPWLIPGNIKTGRKEGKLISYLYYVSDGINNYKMVHHTDQVDQLKTLAYWFEKI